MSYPLQSWLNYDVQFRTLAASNPSLRWDTHHHDLWLQCITPSSIQQSSRWPCPFCGATNHFPTGVPFVPTLQGSFLVDNGMILEDNPQEPAKALLSPKIPQVIQGMYTAGISTFHHVDVTSVSLPMFINTVCQSLSQELLQNRNHAVHPLGRSCGLQYDHSHLNAN